MHDADNDKFSEFQKYLNEVTLQRDVIIIYLNDLTRASIEFKEGTKIPYYLYREAFKTLSNIEINDYYLVTLEIMRLICDLLLKDVDHEWNTFKNYMDLEASVYDIDVFLYIDVLEKYRPDDTFKYAIDKFNNIHRRMPDFTYKNEIIPTKPKIKISGYVK